MFNRKTFGVALCGVLAAGAVAVPTAGAAGGKVKFSCMAPSGTSTTQTVVKGPCKGKGVFKKFSNSVDQSKLPNIKYVFYLKGGTINMSAVTTLGKDAITGPWKVTGGTGKFKKAKGKGKVSGFFNKPFVFTGKLTY